MRKKYLIPMATIFCLGLATSAWYATNRHNDKVVTRTAAVSHGPSPSQCVNKLPNNYLAGQVLMVGLPSSQMTTQASMFKQYDIGAAALMTAPDNPYDGSINNFKQAAAAAGVEPLISTDEEGGIVQRFSVLGSLPSPGEVAQTLTTAQARSLIKEHGLKLKQFGVDMVLGPLADVAPLAGTSVLGNRVFSSNPQTVSDFDKAYVEGWQSAGLLPTLKHFPGMGSASANTDFSPATTPPLSQLEKRDFVPYRQLSSSGAAVMVGNQNVPGWFTGPASLSPTVHRYLRQTLGYMNNLIVTDSLSAKAITSTTSEPQAIDQAIIAGNDMALIVEDSSSTDSADRQLISQSETLIENSIKSGTLPKQQIVNSVIRKLKSQNVNPCSIQITS